MTRWYAVGVLALLFSHPAVAHDYWLEPDTFFPAVGQPVAVRLHVGEHFKSEAERPFQPKRTTVFQLLGPTAALDLTKTGTPDQTPAARLTPTAPGTHLVRMDRPPQYLQLAADKFDAYLAEEGLEAVRAERKRLGEDRKDGRERYSRCLKLLVQAGPTPTDGWTKPVGQTLELLPAANPYTLKPGDALTVRVRFDGKPLVGAKVSAYRRAAGAVTTQSATTDADGAVSVKLDAAGDWLVRLVHMRRTTDGGDADWESFWAAVTFGVK